jgi:hypothetical protein
VSTGYEGKVQVWNPDDDSTAWVSPQEAASGMIAWAAREYGKGTPAFAAVVMRAVELLAGHGLTPGGQRIGGTS